MSGPDPSPPVGSVSLRPSPSPSPPPLVEPVTPRLDREPEPVDGGTLPRRAREMAGVPKTPPGLPFMLLFDPASRSDALDATLSMTFFKRSASPATAQITMHLSHYAKSNILLSVTCFRRARLLLWLPYQAAPITAVLYAYLLRYTTLLTSMALRRVWVPYNYLTAFSGTPNVTSLNTHE
ncbi:hypothetical protein BV898_04281 [Hypsibius exemplaris]|uniref:Uncharacterized protein n=1 Tax=Hypsibius exemplaris TaxID=2072580 RepID=A0A1W0X309_HYPEX|nr:hypothetical protein BV898_04281 [Hypsibius exemplaris]